MDRYVTVEEDRGTGKLLQDGRVVLDRVAYSLKVSQRMIEARTMGGSSEIPGLKSIQGWLSDDVPYALIGEPVVLVLEDGRRWDCFIQSSSGNLVNRGGLSEAV